MKYRLMAALISVFVGSFLFSPSAHAVDIDIKNCPNAGTDQRCWMIDDCLAQRKFISLDTLNDIQLKAGFIVNEETKCSCGTDKNAAGKAIGFCLPAGQAETAISFGGQRRFANMGEFIAMIYRYGTWSATIIAVFMVVISGIQWMVSGGNSGMIDSAKKRIGGAIIGLVLLALSYTVLNTINPYLVNFRLPNVWLINEIKVAPPMCSGLNEGQSVLAMSETPNKEFTIDQKEKFYKANQYSDKFLAVGDDAKKSTACGVEYLVKDAGYQTCTGSGCPGPDASSFGVCAPYDIQGGAAGQKIDGFNCKNSQIVVHLFMSGFWQKNIWQNIPWSGALSGKTAEIPDWLAIDPNGPYEPKEIIYQCGDGKWKWVNADKNSYLDIDIAKPGQKAKDKIMATTHDFYEYELRYYNLDNLKCGDEPPTKILLKNEINLDVDTDEPNFFIGRIGKTDQAIMGTFSQVENYAIPWEDAARGGIFLKAGVEDSVISAIAEDVNNYLPTPLPTTPQQHELQQDAYRNIYFSQK